MEAIQQDEECPSKPRTNGQFVLAYDVYEFEEAARRAS